MLHAIGYGILGGIAGAMFGVCFGSLLIVDEDHMIASSLVFIITFGILGFLAVFLINL